MRKIQDPSNHLNFIRYQEKEFLLQKKKYLSNYYKIYLFLSYFCFSLNILILFLFFYKFNLFNIQPITFFILFLLGLCLDSFFIFKYIKCKSAIKKIDIDLKNLSYCESIVKKNIS